MPRNVTVTLADGTRHVYANVPDNATPGTVLARAAKDFAGVRVTNIDGGRTDAPVRLQPTAPPIRSVVHAAPPAPLPRTSAGGAFWRGLEDAVPFKNYLQAAGNEVGSALGLNNTRMSYMDRVRALKARNDQLEEADRQQHSVAHYGGEIGGLVLGGGAIGTGAKALRATRVLKPLANVLQRSRLARVAATSAGGAAGGAVYSAGDAAPENAGREAVRGAEFGAVAAPVAGVGFKAAQVLTRPFRDILRMTSAGRFLSRLTSATTEQLTRRANAYREATGAEPTLFELLPLADRNKLVKQGIVGRDSVVEAASTAIRRRANNLGTEMSARARAVLQPNRDAIHAKLLDDLESARGGKLTAEDHDLAARAMDSPTDMEQLRDTEYKAIMAPHASTPAAQTFEEILPQVPQNRNGTIVMMDPAPKVTDAIRSAVPSGFRKPNQGVTAGDISDMITELRKDLKKGGIEGRTAQQAIEHLEGELGARVPEAAVAHAQATDAYAARSRMMEGMAEGDATRLRNQVQVKTSGKLAREVRNAYDTPEGAAGRAVGQSNKILTDLEGSPEDALRSTIAMSRNGIGRQLEENVGTDAAGKIKAAARAQDESAQALSAASGKMQSGGDSGNAETLVQAIAGLHPSSFVTTKAGSLRKLADMTYVPNSRARIMVDMLFSQDPAMTQRAINALGNEPNGRQFMRYLTGAVGVASAGTGAAGGEEAPEPAPPEQPAAPAPVDSALPGEAPAEAPPVDSPVDPSQSPYAMNLQQLEASENPDLLALINRQFNQESGGHQFGPDGKPLTSSAGAVGFAQVMPHTGPEAASDAGLPWDETAYRGDPVYNKLLGIGYMSKLLRKHNGDVARALASYNAGPDRVDHALSAGDNWLTRLPAETQDYVQRIAG